MKILDNINTLWGDDLKKTLKSGSKLNETPSRGQLKMESGK